MSVGLVGRTPPWPRCWHDSLRCTLILHVCFKTLGSQHGVHTGSMTIVTLARLFLPVGDRGCKMMGMLEATR